MPSRVQPTTGLLLLCAEALQSLLLAANDKTRADALRVYYDQVVAELERRPVTDAEASDVIPLPVEGAQEE